MKEKKMNDNEKLKRKLKVSGKALTPLSLQINTFLQNELATKITACGSIEELVVYEYSSRCEILITTSGESKLLMRMALNSSWRDSEWKEIFTRLGLS